MGHSNNITIGIESMSFNATVQKGNYVQLDWQTATETNNKAYIIERKINNLPFFKK